MSRAAKSDSEKLLVLLNLIKGSIAALEVLPFPSRRQEAQRLHLGTWLDLSLLCAILCPDYNPPIANNNNNKSKDDRMSPSPAQSHVWGAGASEVESAARFDRLSGDLQRQVGRECWNPKEELDHHIAQPMWTPEIPHSGFPSLDPHFHKAARCRRTSRSKIEV